MYLSKHNLAVHHPHAHNAFALTPTTAAVEIAEALRLSEGLGVTVVTAE